MLPNPQNFNQICRLCLSNSEELLNLFESETEIFNLLISITAISITADDDLPQSICPFCLHQIKSTHYFIRKCQESDEKLRLSLHDTLDQSDDNDNTFPTEAQFLNEIKVKFQEIVAPRQRPPRNASNKQTKRVVRQLTIGKSLENEESHESELFNQTEIADATECQITVPNEDSLPKNKCNICNKTLANLKNLERHKLTHETDRKPNEFQCQICGKQTKHINHLNIHMRTHKNVGGNPNISSNAMAPEKKKQFICLTCGRACTSQSNLTAHTRRHTWKMSNFCDICGKGYPRSTDLTIHMRKHTGEKPFACSTCNRGFARSDKLTVHMRTHTGEKPYSCSGCTRSFAQRNDLISHQRRNVCGSI